MGGVVSGIGNFIGDLTGANRQADAASAAANQQSAQYNQAIDLQNQQFNKIVEMLSPYVSAGSSALTGQQNLLGLNGTGAQQTAINAIQSSPTYKTLLQQGENSILQNASATGGLRGGNTQSALSQFSPTLLNNLIQQQYSNLGGLTSLGQSSAAMQGTAGQNMANNVSNLLGNIGRTQAGSTIAQGNAAQSGLNSAWNIAGNLLSLGGLF